MAPELRKSIAEYVIGDRHELTLVGSPVELSVVYEAARTSRNLMKALSSGDMSIISAAIEEKRSAVSRYENVFGSQWSL